MKKWKSITLLTIISILMAALIVVTFARFPVGLKDFNGILGAIETDYDISGGTAYQLEISEDNLEEVKDIESVVDTLKFRLEALGYENYTVKASRPVGEEYSDYVITIATKALTNNFGQPDLTTLDADIETVAMYGQLKFFGGVEQNPTTEILEGKKVVDSVETVRNKDGTYYVNITFTETAYEYISKQMTSGSYYLKATIGDTTTFFDGNTALSASNFGETITLTTAAESAAKQVELQITSGGLAYKYEVKQLGSISSPYGDNVELYCIIIIAALIVLASVALIIMYKGYGIASALALILFILVETAMLVAIPGIKVSLGSVIGIILATILTIDGFIITTKRIREEFSNGKTIKAAIKTGFNRALRPVINVSVVSAILALVLFLMTSGQVKAFAITFGIGTVISAICTLAVVRLFVTLMFSVSSKKQALFKLGKDEKVNEEEQL